MVSDGNNGSAELITPWLTYNATQNCRISVYYTLNGVDVDYVIFIFERLYLTPVGHEVGFVRKFTRRNNRGNVWINAVFPVDTILGGQRFLPFRLRISGGVNGKPYGDVAVDSISFSPCPNTGELYLLHFSFQFIVSQPCMSQHPLVRMISLNVSFPAVL